MVFSPSFCVDYYQKRVQIFLMRCGDAPSLSPRSPTILSFIVAFSFSLSLSLCLSCSLPLLSLFFFGRVLIVLFLILFSGVGEMLLVLVQEIEK